MDFLISFIFLKSIRSKLNNFTIPTPISTNQNQKNQKLPNQLERRKRTNSIKLIRKLKPKEKP